MPRPSISELLIYDEVHPQGAGSSREEKLFLFSLLRMIEPWSVLEIGVSRGHMTAWLALALYMNGRGKLTSVDNWSRAHGGEANGPEYAQKRLKELKLQNYVEFKKSDSYEYLKEQPDDSFDVVWVDGDHSFEGARKDIDEAMRVAKRLVGVHDTHQKYDGPRKAVMDLAMEAGFWVEGGRGIWLLNLC